jgi:hypothetical protein
VFQSLLSPAVAPATFSALAFLQALAPDNNVIAAGSSTITVASNTQQSAKGYDIVIISGTGAGQRRTITAVAEPTIVDTGVVTAVNNVQGTLNITDSTKAWNINQYAGYTFRVTGNTGVGQVRRILSNSATVITMGDITQTNKTWNNPSIFSPAINSTAGTQAAYAIESQVLTVDSPWATQPDSTSVCRIQSGLVALSSNNGSAPFYTIQVYDPMTDVWYILPSYTTLLASSGTDMGLLSTSEISSIWARGTAAATSTTTSLVDASRGVSAAPWTVNQWVGYWVHITSGTGEGQIRQIISNTANTLTWASAGTAPTATSRYMITGFDAGTATSGATSVITDSTKTWATNRWVNYQVRILAGTGIGQVRSIASNTTTALTVITPWTTTPDATSVYVIQGDSNKLYITLGGVAAIPMHNFDSTVATFGREQDWGTARIASASVAGNLPVAISTFANSTTTATATTAHPHQFRVGDLVTVRGATDANFNVTNVVIATVPTATTFTYIMAGTPTVTTIAAALTTSTLVDVTKNWTTNQWAGFSVYMNTTTLTGASGAGTGQVLRIASNTSNTLTFVVAGTAPVNGVSRYSISASGAIGAMDQGVATGTQSTTTLQDTTKVGSFTINNSLNSNVITVTGVTSGQLYVGHAVSGTGIPVGSVIAAFGTGTGGTGTYTLSMPCSSTNSGITMASSWVVNGYAGKRLRYIGTSGPVEVFITSNTNNTLTFGGSTAPVTLQTGYVILEQSVKGQGTSTRWAFGTSDPNFRGKYMFSIRGGGVSGFDRIDLTADRVNTIMTSPASETLTTGTMSAYDGIDRIFFHKDATQRVFSLDVVTGKINGGSMYPYAAPNATIGNRMETFTTKDGLKYLWLNRASFAECYRCLVFW